MRGFEWRVFRYRIVQNDSWKNSMTFLTKCITFRHHYTAGHQYAVDSVALADKQTESVWKAAECKDLP